MKAKSAISISKKWVTAKEGGKVYKYQTYRLEGRINGERIRTNRKDKLEALALKQRLEVAAANREQAIIAQNTSLSTEQLREAEAAFLRLDGQSMSKAVDYFLATYREPTTKLTLKEIQPLFIADKAGHISELTLSDYSGSLTRFNEKHGRLKPHEVTSFHIEAHLSTMTHTVKDENGKLVEKKIGPKRWNNLRSDLHAFFQWCSEPPRKWIGFADNPVKEVKKCKIPAKLPDILSAEQCDELMQYVHGFRGGSLLLYFALALFAGIRPSTRRGETVKFIKECRARRLIKASTGVLVIPAHISKTRRIRQVTIQPNLMAWLQTALAMHGTALPPNVEDRVAEVRKHFRLKPDVLRHTFASMHVAKFKSIGDTALQSGNSEAMIRKHYYNIVAEQEARAFWEIYPLHAEDMRLGYERYELALAEKVQHTNGVLSGEDIDRIAKQMPSVTTFINKVAQERRTERAMQSQPQSPAGGDKSQDSIDAFLLTGAADAGEDYVFERDSKA